MDDNYNLTGAWEHIDMSMYGGQLRTKRKIILLTPAKLTIEACSVKLPSPHSGSRNYYIAMLCCAYTSSCRNLLC